MVLKEFSRIEVELIKTLSDIRSAVRLQVAQFPGSRPHRVHRGKQEHMGRQDKKKTF